MVVFETIAALKQHARASGVGPVGQALLARSARRAVGFETRQTRDADLPLGASKLGGAPDLPTDIVWPFNAAVSSANLADMRKVLERIRTGVARISNGAASNVDRRAGRQMDALSRPFPLGFLGQINLGALDGAKGDPLLPRGGMLYVFNEVRGTISSVGAARSIDIRLIHADVEPSALRRVAVPETIRDVFVEGFATIGGYGRDAVSEVASALVAPTDVWTLSPLDANLRSKVRFSTALPAPISRFTLGGWEDPIQSVFRDELTAMRGMGEGGQSVDRTGWRHVVTIAGKAQGAWMITDWYDGDLYVMMHRDDLLAGRFDAACYAKQFT